MTYALPGECLDNARQFVETTSNCEEGFICSGGLCLDASDPCAGIVQYATRINLHQPNPWHRSRETGACVEGECVYETTVNQCEDGEAAPTASARLATSATRIGSATAISDSSAYNLLHAAGMEATAALQPVRAHVAQRLKQMPRPIRSGKRARPKRTLSQL